MSGIRLAAPYLDTGADQLSFALGLPAREALAVAEVRAGGLTVQLRLLGASHQVIAGPVCETVACLPGRPGWLPEAVNEEIGGWKYRFTARIDTYPPQEFGDRAQWLREGLDGRPDALCGIFPGSPDAVTALVVESDAGVAWRTWHAYPQTRQIVTTHTRLEAR
ncbi:DUF2617 family protein [Allostreptomyces psammosilenae]|uniref:DUF2617 family protein n=1 Tax=Allostreptomyces psammosilenae TaxID=1892865 RepID=A0A853A281_9ACTN|nr:DUF2617 family protein [Allostreptomyces psammosilenae]NYI04548.1 hypothetical protein [Allostreptomyces psammosilenae]